MQRRHSEYRQLRRGLERAGGLPVHARSKSHQTWEQGKVPAVRATDVVTGNAPIPHLGESDMPQPGVSTASARATGSFVDELKARVALLTLFVGSMWATFFLSVSMPFLHLDRHGVVPRTLGVPAGHPVCAVVARRTVAHHRQHGWIAGARLAHDVAAYYQLLAGDGRRHARRRTVRVDARRALLGAHRRERLGVRLCRLSRCARLLYARRPLYSRRPVRGRQLLTEYAARRATHLPGSVVAKPSRRRNGRHHCRTAVATNATPSGLTFSRLWSIYRSGKAKSRVACWFFSISVRRVANRSRRHRW
jgi:hypothetical protein